VHAFPPRDPTFQPDPDARRYRQHAADGAKHSERATDNREGGRLHPHADEGGTDAVVISNHGRISFSLDTTRKNKGVGHCTAQQAKKCWCIGRSGHEGHWTVRDEVKNRYNGRLLQDRLCAVCAAPGDGRGTSCHGCKKNTTRLDSGDVLLIAGAFAVHSAKGVEAEPPTPTPHGAPPLPPWVQDLVERRGYRVSVQLRLTNAAQAAKMRRRDVEKYNNPSQAATSWLPSQPQQGAQQTDSRLCSLCRLNFARSQDEGALCNACSVQQQQPGPARQAQRRKQAQQQQCIDLISDDEDEVAVS